MKKMNEAMKELTEVFFNTTFESNRMNELSAKTDEYKKRFNETLNIENKEKHNFVSYSKNYLIAPVTVTGVQNSEKIDLVYMGLNPKFGEDGKKGLGTWDEKRTAEVHGNYYDFYNSYEIFDYLMKGKGNDYYQRFMRVLLSIFSHKSYDSITIEDVREAYGKGKDNKKSDHIAFRNLTDKKTIVIPELIPLHSWKFSISTGKINKLRKEYPEYNQYLTDIFDYITKNLASDGVVLSNGKETSDVLRELLNDDYLGEKASLIYSDQAMDVYEWKGTKWLLMNGQIAPGASPVFNAYNMATFGKKVNEIRKATDFSNIEKAVYIIEKKAGTKRKGSLSKKADKPLKAVKEKKIKEAAVVKKVKVAERKLSRDEKARVKEVLEKVCLEYDLYRNNNYFYPSEIEAYKLDDIGGKPHAVSFEVLYPKNGVALALQLFGSNHDITQKLIANYHESDYPFKIVDTTEFSNRKILPNVIYRWNGEESMETILSNIESNLRSFFESDLEWIANDLWNKLD